MKPYNYPYSLVGKFKHFPWKFHWKEGRYVRFIAYSMGIYSFFLWKIHKAVRSDGQQKEWAQIRAARNHTFFDVPKP